MVQMCVCFSTRRAGERKRDGERQMDEYNLLQIQYLHMQSFYNNKLHVYLKDMFVYVERYNINIILLYKKYIKDY